MNKWSEGNCFEIYMKAAESRWGDDVRAAVHSWDSASSLGLSFFMYDFSFLEPPSEILLTINIDVNVVVQVSSDKGVDDNGDEKGYGGGSMVVDFNDHGFWLEENQQEEVKLNYFFNVPGRPLRNSWLRSSKVCLLLWWYLQFIFVIGCAEWNAKLFQILNYANFYTKFIYEFINQSYKLSQMK